MKHKMKIHTNPFEKIKDGTKTIEVRLNDEKRQLLNVGDEIEFALMDDRYKKIKVEVLELLKYPTFSELFDAYPVNDFGGISKDDLMSIYKYYSKEDEQKYGVLGIRLKYLGEVEDKIPQIIKDVGFDFSWSEEKVWALDVPVEEIDINELTWHFAVPFHWENGVYNLTSQEIIDNPEAHKAEYERTMKADLVHPIDIMENKGRWLILDGLHRLMKSSILGMKKVQVRKIPRERIPDITK